MNRRTTFAILSMIVICMFVGCSARGPIIPTPAPIGASVVSNASLPAQDDELWVIEKPPAISPPAISIPPTGEIPVGGGLLLDIRGTHVSPLALDHTDITAQIDGAIAAVNVRQRFVNPSADAVEAAYAFALPRNAVVNEFVLSIGSRHIRAIIRDSTEAEKVYREARAMGFMASLIVEKSPGVFVQRIANLQPAAIIDVELHYIHTVSYREGWFEFACPMMFRPTNSTVPPPTRSGRDITLNVHLSADIAIEKIESASHPVTIKSRSNAAADVELTAADRIPNSDFLLRYKLASQTIGLSLRTENDGPGGTFALLVIPPTDEKLRPANAARLNIDWHDTKITDVFGKQPVELYPEHPLLLLGRYHGDPPSSVNLGNNLVLSQPTALGKSFKPLACLWAERKINHLASELSLAPEPKLTAQIRNVALEYGLESPYTSFIVVDAATRLTPDRR